MCDFNEREVQATKHRFFFFFFFFADFCYSQRAVITMKDFRDFLDIRRFKNWAHKIGF